MPSLKLTRIGKSVGLILPEDLLARFRVNEGDYLRVVETRNGIELVPCAPEFAAQLNEAEAVMAEDRGTLRKLAD